MLLSMPTIAPTKAFTTTKSENWARFSRRPSFGASVTDPITWRPC